MEDSLLLDIGLPLVLAFVMVGIGMTLTVGDFKRQRKSPKPVLVGLLGQVLGVPLIGFAIAVVLGLPGPLAIGLILVAATSGGTTSNVMTYLAKGNVALSLVLTVVANVASILSLPFWATRALNYWGDEVASASYVSVGFNDVVWLLLAIIVIPVSIGMYIRTKKPALAARLERTVSLVSFIALFGLIIGVVLSLGDQAWTMLSEAGPATLLLATCAVALGFGLGIVTGLPRPDHISLGMEFGIKNVTLTMLIALTALGSEEMALPSAVYGVLAYVPGLALVYFGRRYLAGEPTAIQIDEEDHPTQRRVIVGYDASKATLPALDWAAKEAVAMHVPLRVVLAWGLPTMGVSAVSSTADLNGSSAYAALQNAVSRLRRDVPGLEVDGELVVDKPAQAILDRARGAALVVVGQQRRGRLGRLALGSVSSGVVSHANSTVVVVPADVPVRQDGAVVVGVDGSPASEAAVEFAFRASLNHGQNVVLVHIEDQASVGQIGATAGTMQATALELQVLSPALKAARSRYPAVAVKQVVTTGRPGEVLVEQDENAALIVVGNRGHGGFTGLLLGSVSRAVLEHSQCPVAVVRTQE